MTPDVVFGWLRCAGYGFGLAVVSYIAVKEISRRYRKDRVERIKNARDCRTCAKCIYINNNGYHYCYVSNTLNGYDLPKFCGCYKSLEEVRGGQT